MVCHDELTKDCLTAKLPTLAVWEFSRLKMVSLDTLPTYKRVAAWFSGPVERYLLLLLRLKRGLDTGHWKVYERTRWNPVGPALCSALTQLSPHWREWRGDPSLGWEKTIFSFLGAKAEGKK